jgi:hypothetical protein
VRTSRYLLPALLAVAGALALLPPAGVSALFTASPTVTGNTMSVSSCPRTEVKSVQTGTLTNSANGVQSTGITAVDTTKAVLYFSSRSDSTVPGDSTVRARIASSQRIEFVRDTNTATPPNIYVSYTVVEYTCGVRVQRGEVSLASDPTNITISAVASVNQAFVLWSKTPNPASNNWDANDTAVMDLTSTTNLQLRGTVDTPAHIFDWQVVEFLKASDVYVQRGTTTMTAGATTRDVTLPQAATLSESFVLVNGRNNGGGTDVGARMLAGHLTSTTNLHLSRGIGSGDDFTDIVYQVVDLKDGTRVQNGTTSFPDGTGTMTAALTTVNASRAFAFASYAEAGQSGGSSDYNGATDTPGVAQVTTQVTSANQLTLNRKNFTGNLSVDWTVLDFPAPCGRVDRVQAGSMINNVNGITTVPIESIDPTKSYLVFGVRSNATKPGDSTVRGRLVSATSLEFERVTDTATPPVITITYYVVSYRCGVRVQRGDTGWPDNTNTTLNIPIAALAGTSHAFVLWSHTSRLATSNWDEDDTVVGDLTSATNLQFHGTAVDPATYMSWQVVEFLNTADGYVQRGTTSLTGGATSTTITLSNPVDTGRSFVLVGATTHNNTGSAIGDRLIRARLTAANTLVIDRSVSTVTDVDQIWWQVVQLGDGSTVQSGTATISGGTTGTTVALTAVDTSRSIAFASGQLSAGQSGGRSDRTTNLTAGVGFGTLTLTGSTQLSIDRGATNDNADFGWYVITFTAAPGPNSYNRTCISDDSDRSGGNFDNSGYSYSAQALAAQGVTPGSTIAFSGLSFTWPNVAVAQPDCFQALGQRLPVSGSGRISFLGAATSGAQTGTATVTYTDGTTTSMTLDMSDWVSIGTLWADNTAVVTTTYRNSAAGADVRNVYLYATTPVTLTAGKTVASVTLPNVSNLKVFAIAVGP